MRPTTRPSRRARKYSAVAVLEERVELAVQVRVAFELERRDPRRPGVKPVRQLDELAQVGSTLDRRDLSAWRGTYQWTGRGPRGGSMAPRHPGRGRVASVRMAHANERPGDRGAARRHRPRAAQGHRHARDGPLDRRPSQRRRRRDRLADDPRLPDPRPLPDRRRPRPSARSTASTGVNISFDVLSDNEKQALRPQARPRLAARGRARAGRERDLRRLRQGRRRQVERDRQPRRRAGRRRQAGRRARRRRVGLLAAADVRPQRRARARSTASARSSRSTAADGIKVISIGFFVEQDAAVVWRGPMLHKALQQFLEDVDWGELDYLLIDLPPGHRRRLDDARAAAAAGEVPDRHDAAAGRPEGGAALGRDGRPSSSSRSPA